MASTTTRRPRNNNKIAEETASAAAPESAPATPKRPGGKLGRLVDRLEAAEGATLNELAALTGWQPHTVRAALTRLRQRAFTIRLEAKDGRKAYKLDRAED